MGCARASERASEKRRGADPKSGESKSEKVRKRERERARVGTAVSRIRMLRTPYNGHSTRTASNYRLFLPLPTLPPWPLPLMASSTTTTSRPPFPLFRPLSSLSLSLSSLASGPRNASVLVGETVRRNFHGIHPFLRGLRKRGEEC